jgi:hypothetical protein
VTKADDYRKRAAAITNTRKRRKAGDRAGPEKKAKALNDMADNEDWLAGKIKPKPPRSST